MKYLYVIFLFFILSTATFAVDKTYKASSGDLILDASGDVVVNKNLGVGTSNPDNEVEVRGEISFNKFSNTPASPAAFSDWPNTPVMIRTYDNDFYIANLLGFGYSNDSFYVTDNTIWHFDLYETDAPAEGSKGHTTSASTTNLRLRGPGSLSLLPDGGGNVGIGTTLPSSLLHLSDTSSDAYMRINGPLSGIAGINLTENGSADDWTIALQGANSNKLAIISNTTTAMTIDQSGNIELNPGGTSEIEASIVTGKKTAAGNGTNNRFVSVGPTHALTVHMVCRESTASVASGVWAVGTAYGAANVVKTTGHQQGNITALTLNYENTTPYYLRFYIEYSGSAPICSYSVYGMSESPIVRQ